MQRTIALLRQMKLPFEPAKCKHCGCTSHQRILAGNEDVGYSCGCNIPKGHKIKLIIVE